MLPGINRIFPGQLSVISPHPLIVDIRAAWPDNALEIEKGLRRYKTEFFCLISNQIMLLFVSWSRNSTQISAN